MDIQKVVIDGIHSALGEDQGLIEVSAGMTENKRQFIYSIVKSAKEPSGVQYVLCMHLDYKSAALNIQGYFDEIGMTGLRDTMIYQALRKEGMIDSDFNGWNSDPYDPNFKRGLLLNRSEEARFDELFPNHPLSEMRKFIRGCIANN